MTLNELELAIIDNIKNSLNNVDLNKPQSTLQFIYSIPSNNIIVSEEKNDDLLADMMYYLKRQLYMDISVSTLQDYVNAYHHNRIIDIMYELYGKLDLYVTKPLTTEIINKIIAELT